MRDNTKTFGDLLRSAKEFLFETLPPLFAELSVRCKSVVCEDARGGAQQLVSCVGSLRCVQSTKLDEAFEKDGILGTYMAVYHFARNITEFLSEQQATFSRAMDAGANLTFTVRAPPRPGPPAVVVHTRSWLTLMRAHLQRLSWCRNRWTTSRRTSVHA